MLAFTVLINLLEMSRLFNIPTSQTCYFWSRKHPSHVLIALTHTSPGVIVAVHLHL